jgi:diguanylate cyclase (GGDEF)-like protein
MDDASLAERYRHIVEATALGIGYGRDEFIVDANEAFLVLVGAERSAVVSGIGLRSIIGDDAARNLLARQGPRVCEVARNDGTQAHVTAAMIMLGDGSWLLVAMDLSERIEAERALRHLALHDPTTGMPNRRLLMDRLEHTLTRATRDGTQTAVLFCDIDWFKRINDTYGHRTGDKVLQITATRLASVLRQYDTVARVGGDEFVVVLERLGDPTDATQLAERARLAISAPMRVDENDLQITASIGIALSFRSHEADDLLRRADDAMYRAKNAGRNQVGFSPEDLIAPQ